MFANDRDEIEFLKLFTLKYLVSSAQLSCFATGMNRTLAVGCCSIAAA